MSSKELAYKFDQIINFIWMFLTRCEMLDDVRKIVHRPFLTQTFCKCRHWNPFWLEMPMHMISAWIHTKRFREIILCMHLRLIQTFRLPFSDSQFVCVCECARATLFHMMVINYSNVLVQTWLAITLMPWNRCGDKTATGSILFPFARARKKKYKNKTLWRKYSQLWPFPST